MLIAGERRYRTCLLDTMVISEMVKESGEALIDRFYEWAYLDQPGVVPCFTIYTLMELRRRPELFTRFIERFQKRPCMMVKGYAQLLEDEVACYPNHSSVDPCGIAFTPLGGPGNQLANLPGLLAAIGDKEELWNRAEPEIVDGMVSLVANFPSSGRRYTTDEVRRFVWATSLQQLAYHDESSEFVRQMMADEEVIDTDAFPTLKAMSYTVFYKFYSDATRRPTRSDGFDVLISSALPHVESVITESHQAEALRKIKGRDAFLDHLVVLTLRDFRSGPLPPAARSR